MLENWFQSFIVSLKCKKISTSAILAKSKMELLLTM